MKITKHKRNLRVHCSRIHYKTLLQLPGFKKFEDHGIVDCEPSRANIDFLLDNFPDAVWETGELERVKQFQEFESISLGNYEEFDFDFKLKPYAHQLEAFYRSCDLPAFAYFMEMGTGKTKVLIDNLAYLWKKGEVEGALILAPNGVHEQFVDEQLEIHIPEWCDYYPFVHCSGGKVKWRREYDTFMRYKGPWLKILAMNIEALSHTSGLKKAMEFLNSFEGHPTKKVLIAVDESTRIKVQGSTRSKNVFKLRKLCSHARILSGSPITRGVEDLFNQFKFLSPDILGFTSMYTFRNRYCVTESHPYFNKAKGKMDEYVTISDYKELDELKRKIMPWCHRATKEECLDLPPKIYKNRFVPLSDEQRKAYRELAREMEVTVEDKYLTATIAIVRLTKLQQILCGFLKMEDGTIHRFPKVPRFDATLETVEEAQGQVVIWARFTDDIDRLCDLFQGDCVRYDGRVSKEDRRKGRELFLEKKKRIFIGKPASGGLGLNWLIGSNDVIYFSNSFDAEHRWQSEDRTHRMGTVGHTTYTDLMVPKSVDTYIINALRTKKDVASMVTDDLRTMLRKIIENAKNV